MPVKHDEDRSSSMKRRHLLKIDKVVSHDAIARKSDGNWGHKYRSRPNKRAGRRSRVPGTIRFWPEYERARYWRRVTQNRNGAALVYRPIRKEVLNILCIITHKIQRFEGIFMLYIPMNRNIVVN